MFEGICDVINAVLGVSAVLVLQEQMRETEGRYYLPDGKGKEVWSQLQKFF